jgi:glycosyltransferase involved in cell wall biosynthesis
VSAKVDLHVHSRYSDRPSEWLLRRIGAPECFTEPREVYDRCRASGMDFVTISDHDCIRGALEIAHLPGAFLSAEVTTSFPEDGCKVHCLVIGITEEQFAAIEEVRCDIYAFRDLLSAEGILYSIAHPLFAVDDKMTIDHFEKLLVLFKRFEGLNGARDPRARLVAQGVFDALTPAAIDHLAERHRIEPREPEPWKKVLTGGSDDHGGLYIASAWTVTPAASTVEELLGHLRDYRHSCAGVDGTSLDLARTFFSIGQRFYQGRLASRAGAGNDLVDELFSRLLDREGTPTPVAAAIGGAPVGATAAERCFGRATALFDQLMSSAVPSAAGHLEQGRLVESYQSVSSLAPIGVCLVPYLAAFHTQNKDRRLLDRVAAGWGGGAHSRSRHLAWFTDTYDEPNGVARTIETFARAARERGDAMTVFTCLDLEPAETNVRNFRPTARLELAEYRGQVLNVPPLLEVLRECERLGVTDVVVSTPGPMGATALLAAWALTLGTTGVYHTDFPAYVRSFTESASLERLTWSFMRWFFGRMDVVFVPSRLYIDDLTERGFDRSRMKLMPRGVDLDRFGPRFRDPGFWRRLGGNDGLRFAFVGRVSKEKNLDVMLEAFLALRALGEEVELAVVGDGPYRAELERRFASPHVLFTGTLQGEDLATAFASSDVFVFPSRTDTFGNVVLEAQASGLPAIVSDRCGAHEAVEQEGWGVVVDTSVPGPLSDAMASLARDAQRRREMGLLALATVGARSHHRWAKTFWDQIQEGVAAPAAAGVSPTPRAARRGLQPWPEVVSNAIASRR